MSFASVARKSNFEPPSILFKPPLPHAQTSDLSSLLFPRGLDKPRPAKPGLPRTPPPCNPCCAALTAAAAAADCSDSNSSCCSRSQQLRQQQSQCSINSCGSATKLQRCSTAPRACHSPAVATPLPQNPCGRVLERSIR